MVLGALATGTDRLVARHRLARTFRSQHVVTGIRVDGVGNITTETQSWEEYWRIDTADVPQAARSSLLDFHGTWSRYIASNFGVDLAVPYCHAFFNLLRVALDCSEKSFLQKVISFENFRITSSQIAGLAGGTTTIRNPVYLLAKISESVAYDDPKFLPLIALPATDESLHIFYHYRHYKIANPSTGLLLYPAAEPEHRSSSFVVLEMLAAGLRNKPDPFFKQRASLIAELAIRPFLSQTSTEDRLIHFLDLGAGSGALTSRLFESLSAGFPHTRFAAKFVDLDVRDPARHFHSPTLRRCMSHLEYERDDYRTWLCSRGHSEHFDVALLCRLLNNASTFDVKWTCDPDDLAFLAGAGRGADSLATESFQPRVCLDSANPQPRSLIVSNRKVPFRNYGAFRQLSLTDYFQGLWRLTQPHPTVVPPNTVFFAAREFNTSSLILPDGKSIFTPLVQMADLVVVEDVDLNPDQLCDHLREHNLIELAASDATDYARMQSARLLCITSRQRGDELPGKRLW